MGSDHREWSRPHFTRGSERATKFCTVRSMEVTLVDTTYHLPRLVQSLGSPSSQQRRVTTSFTNEGMNECTFAVVLELQRELQL